MVTAVTAHRVGDYQLSRRVLVISKNVFAEATVLTRQDPAAGALTTSGTAGKYAAISERDLRSVAVP